MSQITAACDKHIGHPPFLAIYGRSQQPVEFTRDVCAFVYTIFLLISQSESLKGIHLVFQAFEKQGTVLDSIDLTSQLGE